ncbi:uncharacterized protein PSANT_05620 [Moesziomyces antarcticus]|nr:uncharacterized protein PSANT_05620 [Moesziomyces antarcticus]
MAIGAPLVYADQAYSIYRKQDARGFSHDVCAVLLLANITRCFFWLGERFEFALLLQSILMIAAQLGLLYLCIRFKPVTRFSKSISSDGARVVFNADEDQQPSQTSQPSRSTTHDLMDVHAAEQEEDQLYADKQPLLVTLGSLFRGNSYGRLSSTDPTTSAGGLPPPNTSSRTRSLMAALKPSGSRPLNFWQWADYNSYLVFLALFSLLLLLLYVIFSSSTTFIAVLGYVALGLESTLPIPQLIANHRRKSLAGFRASVLLGWLGGDSFKLLYFVLRSSPVQFTSCAAFQLSIDLAILAQSRVYRQNTERDEEAMRSNAQPNTQQQRAQDEIEEDEHVPTTSQPKPKNKQKQKQKVASEEDELLDPHHVIAIEADDEGDLSNSRT